MTGGSLGYYVYAFKVETDESAEFYIYVSTEPDLADACPVPIPDGITAPAVAYDVQAVKVASVDWSAILSGFVVNQHVVGSITWPSPAPAEPEPPYVNQFELSVQDVDIGEGVIVPALKIASGAHIYRPINVDCDDTQYTENLTADPSGPSPVDVVNGTGSSRPWASEDGYVNISAGDFYVYAFKVENDDEAQFYIYVSKSSDKLDACPVPLPAGITPPAGIYTVQGLLIGSASYGAGWTVTQNIVGSITWPQDIVTPDIEQFTVRVESVETAKVIKVARGRVISGVGDLPPNAGFQSFNAYTKTFDLRNIAVYPTGSSVVGIDSESVWANNNGYIEIPEGATSIGVYIICNQNKQFPAFNNLIQGWPYLAIMVDDSDADVKTRPWKPNYDNEQSWWTVWIHTANFIEIENPSPVPPTRFYGEDANDISYGPETFTVKLQNYNCQRIRIAQLTLDGLTGNWSVDQSLIGTLTIPHNYTYAGIRRVAYSSTQTGYPTWWQVPDYSANQESWEKSYTGSTKWDGTGAAPTLDNGY
jgi:hypothetical protein